MTLNHASASVLLAGVAFLLFGLSLASDSLQKIASNRIRHILNRLDENGLIGIAVGTLLTLLMQSAGAVTATMVSLGTARVISLPQVMGVIIGTAIGAALTVQLISLNVSNFGLPLFVTGFVLAFFIKRKKARNFFEFLMGVGLLFFGLELISASASQLVEISGITSAINFLRDNWVISFVASFLLTTVFHSSTATLGIIMALAMSDVMNVIDTLPWIYGANVGTASTGLIASTQGNFLGKQIAWANFLYRSASVVLYLPFAGFIAERVTTSGSPIGAQVASIYLSLNVIGAAIFYPMRKLGVKLIEAAIVPGESEKDFGVKFLKRSTYENFSLGLAHAKREILEMGDIVLQMVEMSIDAFHDESPEIVEKIHLLDNRVDLLLKEIKLFLIRVSDQAPEGLNQAVIDIISVGSELEEAADLIDHHVVALAGKKCGNRLEFSQEGWDGLRKLHQVSVRTVSVASTYFQTEDKSLAQQVCDLRLEAQNIEQSVRETHITRLSRGNGENMGISAIYLETISTYLQLVELLSRHALRTSDNSEGGRRRSKPA